jgi:hypothetical protein
MKFGYQVGRVLAQSVIIPHLAAEVRLSICGGQTDIEIRLFPIIFVLRPLTPFQCRGHERVEQYLYSLYGPYGLYRASVPVPGCTLPYRLLCAVNSNQTNAPHLHTAATGRTSEGSLRTFKKQCSFGNREESDRKNFNILSTIKELKIPSVIF